MTGMRKIKLSYRRFFFGYQSRLGIFFLVEEAICGDSEGKIVYGMEMDKIGRVRG